jgi:hypothetical protein
MAVVAENSKKKMCLGAHYRGEKQKSWLFLKKS